MVYVAPTQTAEDIKRWKALIYGGNTHMQVTEFVSSEQATAPTRRKSNAVKKRYSAPTIPSTSDNEWLSSSPSKRSYQTKVSSRW